MPLISINDFLQNLSHYHRKYTHFENFALASTFCHIPFPNMNSNKLSPSFTDFNTFYIVIALKILTNCLNFESTNNFASEVFFYFFFFLVSPLLLHKFGHYFVCLHFGCSLGGTGFILYHTTLFVQNFPEHTF